MNEPTHPVHPLGFTEELPIEEIDDALGEEVFERVAKKLGIEPWVRKTPEEVAAEFAEERARREAES